MQLAFGLILGSLQFLGPENMLEFESYQEAAYDLFVREHGMSICLDEFLESHFALQRRYDSTLTEASFRVILASQLTPFATLSFAQRFSTAINTIGWPVSIFVDILFRPEPTKTVAQADKDGKTALHWAAAHFGEWSCAYHCYPGVALEHDEPRKRAESYRSLASELVGMGSDIHALWYAPVYGFGEIHSQGCDPFIIFLRGLRHKGPGSADTSWNKDSLSNAVNRWGQMLVARGYSLTDYVATENRFLGRSHWIDACQSKWTFSPTKLSILEDGTLSVHVVDGVNVPVWKIEPIHVPGAWPVLSTSSSTIIWVPDAEDERDGFQWLKIASVTIVSDSYQVQPLDISARSSDMTDLAHTARQELISLTAQDDHGILANTITRESRFCHDHSRSHGRKRAASLPPLPAGTQYDLYEDAPEATRYHSAGRIYQVHKCVFDLRWSGSEECGTSLRKCMQGHQRDRTRSNSQQPSPKGWELDLLCDEDHIREARRFAERFYPGHMWLVEYRSEIAAQRAWLTMGPRRSQDDGV
jgi:hypothetical protein